MKPYLIDELLEYDGRYFFRHTAPGPPCSEQTPCCICLMREAFSTDLEFHNTIHRGRRGNKWRWSVPATPASVHKLIQIYPNAEALFRELHRGDVTPPPHEQLALDLP